MDIFAIPFRLAKWRHEPVPAFIRRRERDTARQIQPIRHRALAVILEHLDIVDQADTSSEAPKILEVPGDAARWQIIRKGGCAIPVLLEPALDRPGERSLTWGSCTASISTTR